MTNDHKTRREWKIQLTMRINFISLKGSKETRTMYNTSRNTEIIMGNKTIMILLKNFTNLFYKIIKKI